MGIGSLFGVTEPDSGDVRTTLCVHLKPHGEFHVTCEILLCEIYLHF